MLSGKSDSPSVLRGTAFEVTRTHTRAPHRSNREGIYTAGYLGLAPVLTAQLIAFGGVFDDNPFAAMLTGACSAGTIAALLTHPVDTAKTCIQSDMTGKEGWKNARTALPRLIREGGIRSLYQGGLARTLRLCGAFLVCMTLREKAIDFKSSSAASEVAF